MVGGQSRGSHVLLDYRNYSSTEENDGRWMLHLIRECVRAVSYTHLTLPTSPKV